MKNILSFWGLWLLIVPALLGQDLFDDEVLRMMKLSFENPNYHEVMVDEWFENTGNRQLASLEMDGVVYDSVGVRYKGNSTFFVVNEFGNRKLPLNIDFNDYIKGQDLLGISSIKLANDYFDPSMIREVLGYSIYNQYLPSPKASFVNVFVEDEFLGVYANTESINKEFIKDRFGNKNGAFFKCEPAGQFGVDENTDAPDLKWLGPDSAAYENAYEIKSDAGWADLLNFINILNNRPDEVETVFNVDRALWCLAVNTVLANYDSYNGVFVHNYYLYQNENGLFEMIPWDVSESFVGALYNRGDSLYNLESLYQFDPFVREDPLYQNRPLLQYIDNHPVYKKQYAAHIRTIIDEIINQNYVATKGKELQNLIGLDMLKDKNALFGFSIFHFTNNLNAKTTLGDLEVPGVTVAATERANFLSSLPEISATPPTIQSVNRTSGSPFVGEQIFVTAEISNAIQIDLMVTKNKFASHFQAIEMLDDGNHGDGAANDGVFGAMIPFNQFEDKVKYFVRAQNENALSLMPKRAEYEFFEYTVTGAVSEEESDVVINELMASNDATAADQDGEFDDWIELYNKSNVDIDLTGYFLTDNKENLDKYNFPEGTMIPANSYLIIWADEDGMQEGFHANFKLSAGGEEVLLINADTVIIDKVTFEEQTTDFSYARLPNGTGNFAITTPTFNESNGLTSSLIDVDFDGTNLITFPNPVSEKLTVELADNQVSEMNLQLFDIYGRMTKTKTANSFKTHLLLDDLPSGIYYLVVNEAFGKKIMIK